LYGERTVEEPCEREFFDFEIFLQRKQRSLSAEAQKSRNLCAGALIEAQGFFST
jgi:hypothetical protein